MKLHLACRPGMQQGSLGKDCMLGGREAQPALPRATEHKSLSWLWWGALSFPEPPGASSRAGQSLVSAPPPQICQQLSVFFWIFSQRNQGEKPWADSQEAKFWSLPGMVWRLGE